MEPRQNTKPAEGTVTKSVVMTPSLARDVKDRATEEGHNNFSTVVVKAVREYLARMTGQKAA